MRKTVCWHYYCTWVLRVNEHTPHGLLVHKGGYHHRFKHARLQPAAPREKGGHRYSTVVL